MIFQQDKPNETFSWYIEAECVPRYHKDIIGWPYDKTPFVKYISQHSSSSC